MNLLKNLSIRSKLVLVTLVPLLALLYYLQQTVATELQKKNAASQVILDVTQVNALSSVIHELQKERADMTAYVMSRTSSWQSLAAQRDATDHAVFELNKIAMEYDIRFESMWLIDSLPAIRAKANEFMFSKKDDELFLYGKTEMLEEVNRILRSSKSQMVKNRFEDHLALLYAKEYLSWIRGYLAQAIASKDFDDNEYLTVSSVFGKHDMNIQKLRKFGMPEIRTAMERKYTGPFVEKTYSILDLALQDTDLKDFPVTIDTWYANVTTTINALKEIEDFSSEQIRISAAGELASANTNLIRSIIIAVLVVTLIGSVVAIIIKNIVSAVMKIRNAADLMVRGNLDVELDISSKDEIGNLATAFNEMIGVSSTYASIADRIGKGDYSAVVTVRSEKDVLGSALNNMKLNLQELSKQNEIRTWLLTGSSELNDRIRGEKEVKVLAQEVVVHLANYLKAPVAAIYLKEEGQLQMVGSYAFHHRKENTNHFALGQGLVGQAALEKKPIVFSEIPDNYVKITSGLGHAAPRNVIVFPFIYENEVKGVIELGTSHEFRDLDMEFLNLAGNNIAIAFNAAQSRARLKELLEETQRQAEELEVQQEELKQANDQLQEKTNLLQKSEGELKTQQEELQQTNEELEEKANLLEEQKERLETAKMEIENKARELEVTNKYKSEFLANMSHELRTPLNSILILAQLLSENKNKVLGEKEVEFVKNIYNSGSDLLNLINEILDLSKVESGKMELEMSEVYFEDISRDMAAMFSEVAKTHSVDFKIELRADHLGSGFIVTDRQRLFQILRNLLSNAFKFTDRNGKVVLSVGKPSSKVIYRNRNLIAADRVIAFAVSDTGIGIPENKQSIVFEAFQQADGSTKRKYGGTGLGLSICRELATALGGEIQLESVEGEGSTFTLYLPSSLEVSLRETGSRHVEPMPKKEATKKVSVNPTPASATDGETVLDDRNSIRENDKVVLIMEDDLAFCKLLLGFVRERNYKGIVAHQGNTGLSYARLYKPDAIILDMRLPVVDGTEVLKQLKNDPQLRHLPVQIISGFDLRKESIELGAFDFIRKPVSSQQLQSALDKLEDFVNKKMKKLLIVEDNDQQNRAIRELIGNGDVKCFSAYSGSEAIEMLRKEKFDCTIVDLGLPDMLGFDLLKRIKADESLNKIPVVVYTGKDLSKEETSQLNKLADTVVLKTVDSFDRLLDETTLFLHRVESRLPKDKQNIIRNLHKTDEVLRDKTILVVDDDIRNIYSLTNALEEEGVRCLVAENGKTAIEMLKNHRVEMILMDVMMPEMDGYEATREIRKMKTFDKLPIIALTAKAMKGDREKCLAAGMSDYIAKPVNIEQLVSLMRVWLYR
jgi:CheY-like chemotaxis protein/HAMP domain-containing protein